MENYISISHWGLFPVMQTVEEDTHIFLQEKCFEKLYLPEMHPILEVDA